MNPETKQIIKDTIAELLNESDMAKARINAYKANSKGELTTVVTLTFTKDISPTVIKVKD